MHSPETRKQRHTENLTRVGFRNRVILKVTDTYLVILLMSQGLTELPAKCRVFHEITLGQRQAHNLVYIYSPQKE